MVKIQIDVRSEGEFSRRDNLYVAVALSEAIPTDSGREEALFPTGNHQSYSGMIPTGNICLCDAFRGYRCAQPPAIHR